MDTESISSNGTSIHHPGVDYTRQGFPDYASGHHPPGHPSPLQGYNSWHHNSQSQRYSSSSSPSTFEEVESLCLSRSSNDSSTVGHFRTLPRNGLGPSSVGQSQGHLPSGRFLSRQSSATSTSTTSGNLPEHVDRTSRSTSTSGSMLDDNMESMDNRQQYDMNENAFLDGIFRRVLEWNQAYAAVAMGRGGGGVPYVQMSPGLFHSASPGHFPSMPSAAFSPGAFSQMPPVFVPSPAVSHRLQPPGSPKLSSPVMSGGGGSPYKGPVSPGRRVPEAAKDKTRSPTSDITHVKKRRDLILPDEEDEFSFSHSYSRKPEVKTSTTSTPTGQTAATAAFSAKQASSESMLSSMSSMSQSQDLSWREQFDHDWREAQHAMWREQANQGWADPYVNPWRAADTSQQIWRDAAMPLRPSMLPSSGMVLPPGYAHPPRVLNRGMSIESMASLGMVSPTESYMSPYTPSHLQNPAEMMLMNLGFGGCAEGFLPERFLRDWCSKMSRPNQYPVNPQHMPESNCPSQYGTRPSMHSARQTRFPMQSKPSYEDLRSASDLQRRIAQPLNRAATISTSQSIDPPETPTALLPPSLGKESRTDRLKEYIEAYAQNMNNTSDARSLRIRQFASSRQKSLPSYLETLTEEDETKSRGTWHKPQDGESRLQAFLREDSLSTTSGRSDSHGGSSGCASTEHSLVGSESESLSGSDHHDYIQRIRKSHVRSQTQPDSDSSPQPFPVTSRTLILKMPDPAERRARLLSESRNMDSADTASTPENGEHFVFERRPRKPTSRPSPKRGSHVDCSQLSSNCQSKNSPKRSNENPSSVIPRSKRPTSRSRSPNKEPKAQPQNCRQASPMPHKPHVESRQSEAKSSNAADALMVPKTTVSYLGDGYAEPDSLTLKLPHPIDTSRLFVSQTPMESPMRKRSSSRESVLSQASLGRPSRPSVGKESCHLLQVLLNTTSQGFGGDVGNTSYNSLNNENEDLMKCERTDSLTSTESMEVADIFHCSDSISRNDMKQNLSAKFHHAGGIENEGQIEPAMVSIVLEDVDGNLMENGDCFGMGSKHLGHHRPQQIGGIGHQEELLRIPSRASSTSLSPIPLSPVTVIEVSLDNQQDSIDVEEGTSSSRDLNDDEEELTSFDSDSVTSVKEGFKDGGNFDLPDPEMLSVNGISNEKLTSDIQFDREDFSGQGDMHDVCMNVDDQCASLVSVYNAVSPDTSSSSSSSVITDTSRTLEIGVQADDGKLSPLMLLYQENILPVLIQNDSSEELYFVSDQTVQCDSKELQQESEIEKLPPEEELSEFLTLQVTHKGSQTGGPLRYEMSSQTEPLALGTSTSSHGKIASEYKADTNHVCSSCSIQGSDLWHKNRNEAVSDFVSRPVHFPAFSFPVAHHSTRHTPERDGALSTDSEFWEYMGMEVPMKLRPAPLPCSRKRDPSFSTASVMKQVQSHHARHREVRRKPGVSDRNEYIYAFPSDSYEIVKDMSHENSMSPFSHLRPNDAYVPPRRPRFHSSVQQTQLSPAFSRVKTSSPKLAQRHFDFPGTDFTNQTSAPLAGFRAVSSEYRTSSVNKAITRDVTATKDKNQKMTKLLNAKESVESAREGKQQQISQVHVSYLNFTVNDYRGNVEREQTSPARYGAHSKDYAAFESTSGQTVQAHVTDVTALPSNVIVPSLESRVLDQQSQTCRHEETGQQNSSPVGYQRLPDINDREPDLDKDSGIIDTSMSSSQVSCDEDRPERSIQKDRKNVTERGKSIDDYSDKDFSSMAEAREFILTRFLLRGEVDSESKNGGISAKTKAESKDTQAEGDMSVAHGPTVQQRTDKILHDESEDSKSKSSGTDPVIYPLHDSRIFLSHDYRPAESIGVQNAAEEKIICDSADGEQQRSASFPRTSKPLKDTWTERDALKNLAVDCFLLRERSKTVSEGDRGQIVKDEYVPQLPLTHDEGLSSNTSVVEETDITKAPFADFHTDNSDHIEDSRQALLLENFATSVLESTCFDVHKDYEDSMENLQRLFKSQFKLTGLFAGNAVAQSVDVENSQTEKRVLGDPQRGTNSREDCKDSVVSGLNGDVSGKERHDSKLSSPDHLFPREVLDQSDNGVRDNREIQDSVSDSSSELSVVCADSLHLASEAIPPADGNNTLDKHRHSGVSEAYLEASVSQQSFSNPIPLYDYSFRALSPKPVNLPADLEHSLSPARSHSADSLDSLRVNYSGSVDDILDITEGDGRAVELPTGHGHLCEDMTDLSVYPASSMYQHREQAFNKDETRNVSGTDVADRLQYSNETIKHDIPSNFSCTNEQLISNVGITLACPSKTGLYCGSIKSTEEGMVSRQGTEDGDSKTAGQILHSTDGTATTGGADSSELLTDVKLTQLILLGVNHPDFERLKEQGVFRDSFDSSPSFTTPDNELSSDVDDLTLTWPSVRSPTRSEYRPVGVDPYSFASSDIVGESYREIRFEGYLSNISEEEGSSDKSSEQVSDPLISDVDGNSSGRDQQDSSTTVTNVESRHSWVSSDTEETTRTTDSSGELSFRHLPSGFQVGEITEDNSREPEMQSDETSDHHTSEADTAFSFDMESEEVIQMMSQMPVSSAASQFLYHENYETVSIVCDENTKPKSPELYNSAEKSEIHISVQRPTSNGSDDCLPNNSSQTHSFGAEKPAGDSTDTLSDRDLRSCSSSDYPSEDLTDLATSTISSGMSSFTDTNEDTLSVQPPSKRKIRSQLYLSLHPMQDESLDGECTRLLSAAEKREAYNRVTSDRSGFGLSSSFSEENLSSPPLRPRRFQRSLSKESSSSDLSPKRVKRTVSRSSPNFNTGQVFSGNSLQVPNAEECLVSKNAVCQRSRSLPDSENYLRPRCQSPIPDRGIKSGSNSPTYKQTESTIYLPKYSGALPVPQNHSPTTTSPRGPSPIPDVTISSVNQTVELVSFASSPEESSRGASPACGSPQSHSDCDSKGHAQSPDLNYTTRIYTNKSFTSPSQDNGSVSITRESKIYSPSKDNEVNQEKHSSVSSKLHVLQKSEPVFSPDGSPTLMTPSITRTLSSSGDEAGPLQLSTSRIYYSSKHSLLPQPRARLYSFGDINSSSTESPVPSTPSLSRDHSSTSDSSASLRDGQPVSSSAGAQTFPEGSPKLDPAQSNLDTLSNASYSPKIIPAIPDSEHDCSDSKTVNANNTSKEEATVEPCLTQTASPDTRNGDQCSPVIDPRSRASPDDCSPVIDPKSRASSDDNDPLKALYLRRSRFKKPENTFSLQQNSSSSEQSSFETGASPRRAFFWTTDQTTVVSAGESPNQSLMSRDNGDPVSHSYTSTWAHGSMTNDGPRAARKPWMAVSHDSTSSASDQVSSDVSPEHNRNSGFSFNDKIINDVDVTLGLFPGCDSGSGRADSVPENGQGGELNKRSVRELAYQFEKRGSK